MDKKGKRKWGFRQSGCGGGPAKVRLMGKGFEIWLVGAEGLAKAKTRKMGKGFEIP